MSKPTNSEQSSGEIDLIQFFEFFGKKIKALYMLILTPFIYVFVSSIKIIQQHFKTIAIVISIAFVAGLVYDIGTPETYTASMLVKPTYNNEHQINATVAYYNSIVSAEEYEKAAALFQITTEEAQLLKRFSITTIAATETDKLNGYSEFAKSIDTIAIGNLEYKKFSAQKSEANYATYQVTVEALQNTIFRKLSPSIIAIFENNHAKKAQEKTKNLLQLKKEKAVKMLSNINSLQEAYLQILSKNSAQHVKMLGTAPVVLSDERQETHEIAALEMSVLLQKELQELEVQLSHKKELVTIVSELPQIGHAKNSILNQMKFMFPIGTLAIFLIIFFAGRFNTFIAQYNL